MMWYECVCDNRSHDTLKKINNYMKKINNYQWSGLLFPFCIFMLPEGLQQ